MDTNAAEEFAPAHNRVVYECRNCGAHDADNGYYTTPAPALICWNPACKAGRKIGLQDQVQRGVGMFQLSAEETASLTCQPHCRTIHGKRRGR